MSELQTATTSQDALPSLSPTAASIALPLVLLADANRASRVRRLRQLEERGFRVAAARTAFEAIVKASCQLPDLIVVAGSLGEATADETTELLSSCPATAHIPIVRVQTGCRLPAHILP
jgi:CheY-like chemotaxis protein